MHECPFTIGQLLAIYAVLKTRGDERLAALMLDHSRHHEAGKEATGALVQG